MGRLIATLVITLLTTAAGAQDWETTYEFDYSPDAVFITSSGAVLAGTVAGVYRSTNQGETWTQVAEGWAKGFDAEDGFVYVATDEGLMRSEDDGQNWEVIMPSDAESVAIEGQTIIAGGRGGQLYQSDDGGASWFIPNCSTMPKGYDFLVNGAAFVGGQRLYSHYLDGVFTSEGSSWSLDASVVTSFLYEQDGKVYAGDGGTIVVSEDGQAWSSFADTESISVNDVAIQDERVAAATFDGIAVSGDNGESWEMWHGGLQEDETADDVVIDSADYVYAATSCCVRRSARPIESGGTSTAKRGEVELPVRSELLDPYPNPFNPVTTVPFVLAEPAKVTIDVFDGQGRRIDRLISRRFPAGRYDAKWQASGVSSGTYFIRMRVGDRTVSESATVIK